MFHTTNIILYLDYWEKKKWMMKIWLIDVVKYVLNTSAENVMCFHMHDKLM